MKRTKHWTQDELQYLTDQSATQTCEEIAKKLNRTVRSVQHKYNELKLQDHNKVKIGDKYGSLTILEIWQDKISYVKCLCDCGKYYTTRLTLIKCGNRTHCGCLKSLTKRRGYKPSEEKRKERNIKSRQTSNQKYGVDHYSQTEEFKIKRKETNLKKFGVEFPIQNLQIKDQIIKTNIDKYGCEFGLKNSKIREKIQQTIRTKYNADHASQNIIIKEKIKRTNINNGLWYEHNNKNTKELAEEIGICKSTLVKWIKTYGLEEALMMTKRSSGIEQKIQNILDKHNIKYEHNKTIGSYRPDFKFENIIVECDGLYWHSDLVLSDRNYHINKRQFYLDQGYSPLFFREDEINTKSDIIESMILHKLNKSNNIFARKCQITTVDKSWFDKNHLMGHGRGKIIALSYNNEIIAAIQYFVRNNICEIDRFCCRLNTSVVGGFSRLIKKLPMPISTFIDLRYGSGNYLNNLGFELITTYPSFRWVYGNKSYHRFTFPGNSGYEKGMYKIWDCGQAKYLKL